MKYYFADMSEDWKTYRLKIDSTTLESFGYTEYEEDIQHGATYEYEPMGKISLEYFEQLLKRQTDYDLLHIELPCKGCKDKVSMEDILNATCKDCLALLTTK